MLNRIDVNIMFEITFKMLEALGVDTDSKINGSFEQW